MRKTAPVVLLLLSAVAALPLTGCQKISARMEMKKGNEVYKKEDYKAAIQHFDAALKLDPSAGFLWRSVGLSALALYKPDGEGPENEKYAQLAIDAFGKYIQAVPDDAKGKSYLLTTFMTAKRFDDALAYLKAEAAKKPTDVALDSSIVSVLIQQDKLKEAYDWASTHASKTDATAFYSIGVVAWSKAYRSPDPDEVKQREMIDFGMKCLDDALRLNPNYADAYIYKGLLLRQVEKLELDPQKKVDLANEANQLRDKGIALKKKADEEAAKAAAAAGT